MNQSVFNAEMVPAGKIVLISDITIMIIYHEREFSEGGRMIFNKSRYYLRKIENGEMTCQQVAGELKIDVNIVEKEYEDYVNPFSDVKAKRKSEIIQIGISFISTIIVLWTLFEMQIARNAAYRPDICISFKIGNAGIESTWDKNGLLKESNLSTFSVPIKVQNIGVGTAKNIDFYWDWETDIKNYVEIINQNDNVKASYNDDQFFIEKNGSTSMYGNYRNINRHIEYLKNEDELGTIWFPDIYYNIVTEAIYVHGIQKLPDFSLNITYSDIQGKQYRKSYNITPHVMKWTDTIEEITCSFVFYVNEMKATMGFWEYLSRFSDLAGTLTAVFALVVSVVALKDSHKYSQLQKEHNEKSVRPIASIIPDDYENCLAVHFINVGIGPLKVRKMIFKSSTEEKSTLVEMIHVFDGPWSTFYDVLDGEVIPADKKICLLKIEKDFDEEGEETLRENIRKELADITVVLEYEDIYGNPFIIEKKLDFFGRHFM